MAKRILIILPWVGYGGIEILLSKLIPHWVDNGFSVTIIAKTIGVDSFNLGEITELHLLGRQFSLLSVPIIGSLIIKNLMKNEPTHIFATGCSQGFLGALVGQFFKQRPKLLIGIFVPWDGCILKKRIGIIARIVNYFDRQMIECEAFNSSFCDESKLFMSEPIRKIYEFNHKRKLEKTNVVCLPITKFEVSDLNFNRHLIVSIGRLCDFKSYNIYMIPIIHSLKQRWPDVKWHIYGSGELMNKMQELVKKYGLSDSITFFGSIDYSDIPRALTGAGLFVGMGTAALEASAAGIPAIIGIGDTDPNNRYSYGFAHELPKGACGEFLSGMNLLDVEEIIDSTFKLKQADYKKIRCAAKSVIRHHDKTTILNEYLHALEESKVATIKISIMLRHFLSALAERTLIMRNILKAKYRSPFEISGVTCNIEKIK